MSGQKVSKREIGCRFSDMFITDHKHVFELNARTCAETFQTFIKTTEQITLQKTLVCLL